MQVMKTWRERAISARKSSGYTLERLAEALDMSVAGVQKWLDGTRQPSLDDINRIASVLQVPPAWLTHGLESDDMLDISGYYQHQKIFHYLSVLGLTCIYPMWILSSSHQRSDEMQLIKITNRQIGHAPIQTVNARELHSYLGVGKDFSNWIKAQIKRADLVAGIDYLLAQKGEKLPSGTKYLTEYHLTIDAGKNIAMLSGTAKGKEVRRYFIDCEARAKAAMSSGTQRQQMRQEGKQVRLAWGGCVQEFVAYARAQGSTNADKYYMAIYQHCKECCLELARSLRKLLPANEPAMRLVAGGAA